MRIIITGASGLIGQALSHYLTTLGHRVGHMKRVTGNGQTVEPPYWHIGKREVEYGEFADIDAIVHLAGESIAQGRWTEEKKRRILASRVESTELLVESIAQLINKPRMVISASAIGFYGNRFDELLDENSSLGSDYVSTVAEQWEAASLPLSEMGIGLVNIRTGLVLSAQGGALEKMIMPFKLGLGGRIGDGAQFMSWISIEDVCKAITFLLQRPTINSQRQVVNLVAPNPVTNKEFTNTLGKALGRPTLFPLPSIIARLMFGQMADELLLSSTRVVPTVLTDMGFKFKHQYLAHALKDIL